MNDTKQCPYCGEEIGINETTCPICGESLEEQIDCQHCGEKIPQSYKHCPYCNEPTRANSPQEYNTKENKEKHIFAPLLDSIYWDQQGSNELVYKFPKEGITTGSVLTVRESQVAYFFKNGTLCDKFTFGRHTLSSQNLPLLNKLVNLPSHGKTTFISEVWFVSKLEKRNCLWGTGGMRIIDPYFQIPVKVSSRGQYGIRIDDGALFLKKLVGTMKMYDTRTIEQQFRTDVIECVKTSIANYMKKQNLNINELGTEYRNVAKFIIKDLQASFDEYGIELLNFNIEDISIDESDAGYKRVMEGVAENARLKQLGVDYLQQKQIDIAQTAAGNEGAGTFMGIGMGIGAGQQMGQIISGALQQMGTGAQIQTPPPPANLSFFVAFNGQTQGPFGIKRIKEMILNGLINTTTYVYRVGGNLWMTAENVLEIKQIFESLMPPPPPQN